MREHEHKTLDLPLPQLSRVCSSEGIAFLADEALFDANGVHLAFPERGGGVSKGDYASLNLGAYTDDAPEHIEANRVHALEAIGAGPYVSSILCPHQVHGDNVIIASDALNLPRAELEKGADGVICTLRHVPVLLAFADCASVVLVTPGGAFAVVHAGWKGAFLGIAGKAFGMLCKTAACRPETVNIYIGPHIGECCYEVSDDLIDSFAARYGKACDVGQRRLSLSAAILSNLTSVGAVRNRIVDSCICTFDEQERFYSYRGSHGHCGRHGALVCRL